MPFEPGKSGNPGGRPRLPAEVREMARGYTEECIHKAGALIKHEDPNVALKAIQFLTDRAWGKPTQPISGDDDGPPLKSLVEVRFVKAEDRRGG